MMNSLLDLIDEVKLDARSWHPIHGACICSLLIVEFRVRVIALIFKHVDDAIIAKAAVQRGVDDFGVTRPAKMHFATRCEHAHIDVTQLVVDMQWAHPIMYLLAVIVSSRRVRKWRIQAVKMPVLGAEIALDDGALAESRLLTRVAQDSVALGILYLVVVWRFVIAWSASARIVSMNRPTVM